MGCDIHFYVETRIHDQWTSADTWEDEEEEDNNGVTIKRKTASYEKRFYTGRNYCLFSILADVRNGYGFAGVDTGDGFVPISKPRGLPTDVPELVKSESDTYGEDGHSHSWLLVSELLAYDWTQVTSQRGVVNGLEYHEWIRYKKQENESPDSYSGGVSGTGIIHVSEAEMARRLAEVVKGRDYWASQIDVKESLSRVYCQIQWDQPYYKTVRSFLSDTLPRLWQLGAPKDVRIVFWFDN